MEFKYNINYNALMFAAEEGHTEIVELLLRQENILIDVKNILKLKHSWSLNLIFFKKFEMLKIYGIFK